MALELNTALDDQSAVNFFVCYALAHAVSLFRPSINLILYLKNET